MSFKPMLASNIKIKDLRLPTLTSLKLEGVRGEFTPDGLMSRPMKRFNNRNLQLMFAELVLYCREKGIYVEGEFYKHGKTFSEISSICRRANHHETDQLEFHIFDAWNPDDPDLPFCDRYEDIQRIVKEVSSESVVACNQLDIDHEEIQGLYEVAIDDGYEGLCFKNPDAKYKGGRPTKADQQFMRIKPEETWDGVVLEIVERMENLVESVPNELGYMSKTQDKDMKAPTGMAAVAITQCKEFDEPVRVTLSKGLTDRDREDIWADRDYYVGKHLKFVGMRISGMDLPRSPRFLDWRTDLD